MTSRPDVSVIVPTYNNAPFLRRTLDSILAQAGRPFEVIVVDDASTDGTPELLADYGDRVATVRLEKNWGGPAHPRNAGIARARGKYINVFDADDIMAPGKIARQAAFLDAHPDIVFVFGNFRNFSDARGPAADDFLKDHADFHAMPKQKLADGWRIAREDAFPTLLVDNYIGTPGAMFRKTLVDDIGGFDESVKNSDDVDFFYRTARRFDLGFIDEILFERRLHPTNISSRPEALRARIKIRMKLKSLPLSRREARALDRSLSRLHFSFAQVEKAGGRKASAFRHLWHSWRFDRSQWKAVKSMAGLLK